MWVWWLDVLANFRAQYVVVLLVLAICVVGFGFYRGWFALSSPSPTAGSNEVNINLATDTDKMKEDAQTVKDKAFVADAEKQKLEIELVTGEQTLKVLKRLYQAPPEIVERAKAAMK